MFEDGAIYDPKVLDIKDEDILDSVMVAITRIAAASLELGYPTLASIPHSVINGFSGAKVAGTRDNHPSSCVAACHAIGMMPFLPQLYQSGSGLTGNL